MGAYDRCIAHNLVRCAMCDRPQASGVASAQVNNTPIPSEMLDGPTDAIRVIDGNTDEDAGFVVPMNAVRAIVGKPDPIVRNPIVEAAHAYSQAQQQVDITARNVKRVKVDLEDAENAYTEAIADRDMKKQVLQKLVAE